MFCGTDKIMQNILHIQSKWGIFHNKILSVPQNILMDLNDVRWPNIILPMLPFFDKIDIVCD